MAERTERKRSPSEALMDGVRWRELAAIEGGEGDLWATHEGELEIGDVTLRCYTLNDGRRVFDMDDVRKHFWPADEEAD